jgi:hypothetical protein
LGIKKINIILINNIILKKINIMGLIFFNIITVTVTYGLIYRYSIKLLYDYNYLLYII